MKILFVNTWIHPKNLISIQQYKNIQFHIITDVNDIANYDLSNFDCVFSPSKIFDISNYPNTKFIFGPHVSVFPDNIQSICKKNVVYIQPSKWAVDVWKKLFPVCTNLNLIDIAFSVDTFRFNEIKPINERNQVFIYYKRRNPNELKFIETFLRSRNIEYKIFNYVQHYDENEYIQYLQNSNFGIWIDAHESQGFALEEALSCNVPLLVWNVQSMNQEYASTYTDIPATSIPYWDDRCGEFFYNHNEFTKTFEIFLSKLYSYQPRQYVLDNLSVDVCEQKFINLVNNMKLNNYTNWKEK